MQQRRHYACAWRVLASIAFIVALSKGAAAAGPGESFEDRTLARARAGTLWTKQAWIRLLHYRAGTLAGVNSEVDSAAFFLSPEGKRDPRAELEATLRAFFRPSRTSDSHARCRFPARFHWLDRQLGLSRGLPELACPEFRRFQAALSPDAVTLVYASNAVESPVTAFGHTFLLFQRPGPDVAVEYTAETDTNNPLLYAFKGLFGMFRGRFRRQPAESKLAYYLGEERDLWEYELALSSAERQQVTRHLWELSAAYFHYYYMSENCSYGVLGLLEGAVPRLTLLETTKYVVPPVDTVHALFERPGLVRAIRHRAAKPVRRVPLGQKAPHHGHGSMRFLLGTGFTSQHDDGFASLGYRIALHDLADPSAGHPAQSQIQFMDTRLRYEALRRRLSLNELTFAELFALHPVGLGFQPSWRVRAHGMRLRDAGCPRDDCFAHGLNGAVGLAAATPDEVFTGFAMADGYVLFSGQVDGIGKSFVRAGVGPYAGMRVHAENLLVGLVSGSWSYLPGQAARSTYELRGALRASLARDVALGVEGLIQPRAVEAQFVSYLYF